MQTDTQYNLKIILANLSSLKNNLPAVHKVSEKYVDLFHQEIINLSSIGIINIDNFKIPDAELKPNFIQTNYVSRTGYTDGKYVERPFFMTKLDALLTLFELLDSKQEIGFKT